MTHPWPTRAWARFLLVSLFASGLGFAQPPNPPVTGHPFTGIFDGEGYRLVLGADREGYAGTLTSGGESFPLTAQHANSGIAGTYTTRLGRVPFTATLAGDVLVLRRGGLETRLHRHHLAALEALRLPAPRKYEQLANLGPARPSTARAWTIVVYMAADNDLEPAALDDLQEMLQGVPLQSVDVVALVDRAHDYAVSSPDWTDARVVHIARPRSGTPAQALELAQPGEVDMGDPEVLASFVEGALRAFPAPRRALVLWDHGGGWSQQCLDVDQGDRKGSSGLTLIEVRQGIEKALARAGVARLDVLGFDQCLMAQLETAIECAGVARYLIASQALEPGRGWPWNTVLPVFTPEAATPAIAARVVEAFADSYRGRDDGTTLAALDLDRAAPLSAALDALARALEPRLPDQWPAIARALFYAEAYAGRDDFRQRQSATASADLYDALARARHALRPFAAEAEFAALVAAHRAFVLTARAGPRRALSRGVSVYAPPSRAQMDPAWRQTKLGAGSGWAAFLDKLHVHVARDARPPRLTDARITGEHGDDKDTVTALAGDQLVVSLTGDNVVWTQLEECRGSRSADLIVVRKGFVLDSQWLLRLGQVAAEEVDLMMPTYQDGHSHLRHEMQAMRLLVADARAAGTATMYFDSPDPRAPIRVMASYESPEHRGMWDVEVLFDTVTWDATGLVARVPLPDGRILRRGLEPHHDATLSLWHETVKDGQRGRQRGHLITWGTGPRLILGDDVAGDYTAVLRAETMAGVLGETLVRYRIAESATRTQWRASWRSFQPEALAGTWDQYFLGPNHEPRRLGVTLTIAPVGADRFRVDGVHEHPQGARRSRQTWFLDVERGTLRMLVEGEPGARASAYYGPALWMGRDGLRAKMLNFGGVIWAWHRRQ